MKKLILMVTLFVVVTVLPSWAAFCSNCGIQLPQQANFCSNCGKATSVFSTQTVTQPSAVTYKTTKTSFDGSSTTTTTTTVYTPSNNTTYSPSIELPKTTIVYTQPQTTVVHEGPTIESVILGGALSYFFWKNRPHHHYHYHGPALPPPPPARPHHRVAPPPPPRGGSRGRHR